jgi:hypothetical protein
MKDAEVSAADTNLLDCEYARWIDDPSGAAINNLIAFKLKKSAAAKQ